MKTRKTMLDYCKVILKTVSFNRKLFRKEYRKALYWLSPVEAVSLKMWLRQNSLHHSLHTLKTESNEKIY